MASAATRVANDNQYITVVNDNIIIIILYLYRGKKKAPMKKLNIIYIYICVPSF